MLAPRLLALTAAATLFAAPLTLAPAADAAVHTSTGLRCTIVGTPGANHLRGTVESVEKVAITPEPVEKLEIYLVHQNRTSFS